MRSVMSGSSSATRIVYWSAGLDTDRLPLARSKNPHVGTVSASAIGGNRGDAIDELIRPGRIVVVQGKLLGARENSDIGRVARRAVPPANVLRILLISVLSVHDQQVRPPGKIGQAPILLVDQVRIIAVLELPCIERTTDPEPVGLGVGGVYDRLPISFEPVAETDTRMVEVVRGHLHVVDEELALPHLVKVDFRVHVTEGNGEVGVLHLVGQHLVQTSAGSGQAMEGELVTGDEGGRKERPALNVIPV